MAAIDLSRGSHFESQGNKKLCFCPSILALDERLDGQNLLFQHCVIKFYCQCSAAFIGCIISYRVVCALALVIEHYFMTV